MPTTDRIALGKSGEDLACRELERRGYEVLARRFRTRIGELDIVAMDGGTMVFVEVKTRTGPEYGMPREAVSVLKQRKVWLMACDYVDRQGWHDKACRFDVVEVSIGPNGKPEIGVIQDAFEAFE